MNKGFIRSAARSWHVLIVLMAALLSVSAGCGGGGGGGGAGAAPVVAIADANIVTDSGITNGGADKSSTQTMTGALPNPTGSDTTFGGKAYLVLNGKKIPLDVIATASPVITDPSTTTGSDLFPKNAAKDGKDGKDRLKSINKIKSVLPALRASAAGAVDWVYSVTFSINAGGNTLSIEVYDLNNTLYARTDTWNVVGVIEPTSLVVTLWWNTNGTDIDLHMSPDDGATHCYYGNKSAGQMQLDYDNTSGYGPEHITIDKASGTNKYKIKVYYYADHNTNDPPQTTPTTAYVTATVNGETKLDVSSSLTAESTSSGWSSGSHVWDAGEVEVSAPNRYTVDLADPDLSGFPNVKLTVTVTDPNNAAVPKVTGLAASNFYVINAGKMMSPVSVTAVDNVYTLSFNDILAGKRDIYVYAIKPAEGTTKMQAGLSATKTYGNNYAVFAGLNEYPAQVITDNSWFDDAAQPTKFFVRAWTNKRTNAASGFTVEAADFVTTLTVSTRPTVSVVASGITAEGWDAGKKKYSYLLSYDRPANYTDYVTARTTFKKAIWLSWCVKDTVDLKAALLAKGTGMSNGSWDAANITTFTNSAATKDAILNKIAEVAGTMQKYDLFLFHFSGHGSGMPADGNAAQYLCAYEDGKWISVNDLKAKLQLIPSAGGSITNAIVLLDACHSGNFISLKPQDSADVRDENILMRYRPFVQQIDEAPGSPPGEIRDLTSLSNTFVMAAQTGSSFSWDDGNLKNGVFTYYLVEGINVSGKTVSAAAANSDHSSVVSGEEAFAYLEPKVSSWVTPSHGYGAADFQSPQLQDNSTSTATFLIYNW